MKPDLGGSRRHLAVGEAGFVDLADRCGGGVGQDFSVSEGEVRNGKPEVGVAHGGAESELDKNQRCGDQDDFFEERVGQENVPFCPQEAWAGADGQNAEQAKKRLGEHAVEDANFVFEERNPQAAEETLDADGDKGDAVPAVPGRGGGRRKEGSRRWVAEGVWAG